MDVLDELLEASDRFGIVGDVDRSTLAAVLDPGTQPPAPAFPRHETELVTVEHTIRTGWYARQVQVQVIRTQVGPVRH